METEELENNEQEFKYFAFISYNARDSQWGKRVQRKLENYRMPATLCSEHGWKRKPMKPVFFAPTDIQPGGLSEELQKRLASSRHLIVICSPNSAKSEWVGKEIEYFHGIGRTDNIHFFIVDGTPHSGNPDTECFNPVVERLGMPEILGANIHENNYKWPWLNKERAYVQLISKLLGVEFDSIWQRHKRRLIRKTILWALGILAVLAALFAMWKANQPFTAKVVLHEASVRNDQLPPLHDAVVTLALDNETKTDTIHSPDATASFANIPHSYLDKMARVTFSGPNFMTVDTTLVIARDMTLNIWRDPAVYGNVHLGLWNGKSFIPHAMVTIAGHEVTSDAQGNITLFIPLEEQRPFYKVVTSFPLERDTIVMPCGENDVLVAKLED